MQISKGCIPYGMITDDAENIGLKIIYPKKHKELEIKIIKIKRFMKSPSLI